jgi:hypothetical protein
MIFSILLLENFILFINRNIMKINLLLSLFILCFLFLAITFVCIFPDLWNIYSCIYLYFFYAKKDKLCAHCLYLSFKNATITLYSLIQPMFTEDLECGRHNSSYLGYIHGQKKTTPFLMEVTYIVHIWLLLFRCYLLFCM